MKQRRNIAYGLCLFVLSFSLQAQTDESVNLNVIPPSPNVLSLTKFGDIPVSPYTGTPNISIPIYDYKGKSLSMPVSLKYHAGGIRVEEIASSVGLGWALNAGGCVSRTIRGLPDDMATYGYLYADSLQSCTELMSPYYSSSKCYNYYSGVEDSEQDIFQVSLNNMSFRFTLSKLGEIELDSKTNIQIERVTGSLSHSAYGNISQWIITDEAGIQYYFDEKEYSLVYTSPGTFTPHSSQYVVTAWYLTEVITPDNCETINLTYDEYSYSYNLPMTEVYDLNGYTEYYSSITLYAQRLNSIITSDSLYVFFNYDNTGYRCDLIGDRVLENIEVYSFDKKVTQVDLDYKYMLESSFYAYSTCSSGISALDKRLILDKVQREGENPYSFSYISGLPARDSKSQDHWGFYNGESNETLLPVSYYDNPFTDDVIELGDANRRPDSALTKYGTLSKITYPTGGSTSFEYEINQANDGMLEYSLEGMSYMLDGTTTTSQQIEIHREQLPYTYLKFSLQYLPSQFCDSQCGVRALIKQSGSVVHSVDLLKGELDTASTYLDKIVTSTLGDGTYEFTFQYLREDLCTEMGEDPFILWLTYDNEATEDNKLAGGIRIKRIVDQPDALDSSDQIIRRYSYLSSDSSSSGFILHHPVYLTIFGSLGYPYIFFGSLHSASRVYLGNTQGSPVGYSRVIEHFGNNDENGSIEYQYTSPQYYKDFYGSSHTSEFPYAPPSSFENCRGLLTEKISRNSQGDLVERETNSYDISFTPHEVYSLANIKVGSDESWSGEGKILIGQSYYNYQFKVNLDTTIVIKYFSSDSLMQERDFEYNSEYNKIASIKSKDLSNGNIRVEQFYYPYDFNRNVDVAIDSLFYNNQLESIIISEIWEGADEESLFLTTANVNQYTLLSNIPRLSIVHSLKSDAPLIVSEISEFDPDSLLREPEYYSEEINISKYDSYANILEYKARDGISESIFWGYSGSQPVAKFDNMVYDTITLNINGIKTELEKLDDFTVMISSSTRDSLSNVNNSIRDKMPANVTLMTYTYDPGIGITSETDTNGITTYYVYDVSGRLEYIRDNNWDILKKFIYNYYEDKKISK